MRATALRIVWALMLAAVVVGSFLPAASGPMRMVDLLPLSDKVLHFAGYAVLAFVPALHEPRRTVRRVALGLVALGIALEFAQLLSPGRSFEIADMAADAAGIGSGLVAALFFR